MVSCRGLPAGRLARVGGPAASLGGATDAIEGGEPQPRESPPKDSWPSLARCQYAGLTLASDT